MWQTFLSATAGKKACPTSSPLGQHAIEGLAVSPDGRYLASVGNDGAKLWAVAEPKKVARLVGHRGTVYAAAFTSDGWTLATVGADDLTVRIWDLSPDVHVQKK